MLSEQSLLQERHVYVALLIKNLLVLREIQVIQLFREHAIQLSYRILLESLKNSCNHNVPS